MKLKVIAFDADDTLWVNEPYFQEIENKFCALLEDYLPAHTVSQELFNTQMQNIHLYGYGIKSFILSMIETAVRITENTLNVLVIEKIVQFGKELLEKPIELLDAVDAVLKELSQHYRLVVATKGDLLDQERKLKKSGIDHYFHHIEIMSEKKDKDYQKLIKHLDIQPQEFVMIGNSLKSDILPVLAIGGYAFHVPYHTTWAYERVEHQVEHDNFKSLEKLSDIMPFLR